LFPVEPQALTPHFKPMTYNENIRQRILDILDKETEPIAPCELYQRLGDTETGRYELWYLISHHEVEWVTQKSVRRKR
jgi:hypothetical protein